MLGIGSGTFDPETLVILETAFDEAWITLKTNGSANIRPDELARQESAHLAMEGERDPVRLHDRALGRFDPGNDLARIKLRQALTVRSQVSCGARAPPPSWSPVRSTATGSSPPLRSMRISGNIDDRSVRRRTQRSRRNRQRRRVAAPNAKITKPVLDSGFILEVLIVARHLVPSIQSPTSAGRGRSVTSLAIC